MDQVMNMVMIVFSPQIFWPIIGVISIISILVVIFSFISDKKTREQDLGVNNKLAQLQQIISEKEAGFGELDGRLKAKEEDYSRQLIRLEEQISENETSKIRIKSLEVQLKEKEDSIAKTSSSQAEVDKRTQTLQAEVEKIKKELSLKQEMYSGLKSQYEELEAQIAANSKKYTDEVEKNKKLQEEINELKNKLEQAKKEASAVAQSPRGAVAVSVPILATAQTDLEEKKREKIIEKKPEPPAVIGKKEESLAPGPAEKQTLPLEAKPALPEKPEPVQPPQQPAIGAEASSKLQIPKKPKQPATETKVRLAQVMQEAAKVGGKKEEKEKVRDEDKDKGQPKEGGPIQEQNKPKPPQPPPATPPQPPNPAPA